MYTAMKGKRILACMLAALFALMLFPMPARADDDGYSFENGVLTITSNEGTTAWRNDGSGISKVSVAKVIIQSGVTGIGGSAFYGCTELTSIDIPDSVATIGGSAFYNCKKLTSISLPTALEKISEKMFYGCAALTSIEIPASVGNIDGSAFLNCAALKSVTFAEESTLTSIGSSAFNKCTALESINIPTSVNTIGASAFYGCSALTGIDIPTSVTTINGFTFQNCTVLASINIPASVNKIFGSAFLGCTALTDLTVNSENAHFCIEGNILYNKGKTKLLIYYLADSNASFTIPDTVDEIGNYAFEGCKTLESVNLSSINAMGDYAFRDCTGLISIDIPASVTHIGYDAFGGCKDLTLKFLGNNAPCTLGSKFAGEKVDEKDTSIKEVLYPAAWSSRDVQELKESLGDYYTGTITTYGEVPGGTDSGTRSANIQPAVTTIYNEPAIGEATVSLTGNGLRRGDRLVTEALESGSNYNALIKLADEDDIFGIYDISLESGKALNGSVELTFSLGAQYAGQSFTLAHKKADGSFEYFFATADANGNIKFGPLYELSPFMLIKGILVHAPAHEVLDAPKTGGAQSILPYALLCAAALLFVASAIYKKRRAQA